MEICVVPSLFTWNYVYIYIYLFYLFSSNLSKLQILEFLDQKIGGNLLQVDNFWIANKVQQYLQFLLQAKAVYVTALTLNYK